ncbi:putative ferredoxin [Escherichia marmotae]|nr:putative ferredoxin [Escherichia marmotae]
MLPWLERLEKTPAAQYTRIAHPHVENSPCLASMEKLMRHVIAPELNMGYRQFKTAPP